MRRHSQKIPFNTGIEEYTPSLTLRLEKSEDVLSPDRSLHVADKGTGGVVHEFNADLGNTSTRTSTAKDLTK